MSKDDYTPELEQDENETQDQTEEETTDNVEESEEQEEDEGIDWKAEALKQKAINARISKKIEKSSDTKEKPQESTINISAKDMYALSNAKVDVEDFDEVVDYAKYKGVSIQEALRSDILKTTLATREEHRKTAKATNTGTARKASTEISDEQLLSNFRKGEIPKAGTKEAERLFNLRQKRN